MDGTSVDQSNGNDLVLACRLARTVCRTRNSVLTRVNFELLTDIDIVMFVERGGLIQCSNRYARQALISTGAVKFFLIVSRLVKSTIGTLAARIQFTLNF